MGVSKGLWLKAAVLLKEHLATAQAESAWRRESIGKIIQNDINVDNICYNLAFTVCLAIC